MSRFNKPLPGIPFNYAHPLCPGNQKTVGAAGGAILPLNEGSGTPRLYLPGQQTSVPSTATDRLCTIVGAKWNPYPGANYGTSRWGGPTLSNLTAGTDKINLGINSDFLPYDQATVIVGYKKRTTGNGYVVTTQTSTASQVFLFSLLGSTSTANFYWGGTAAGQLLSVGSLTFGDDVWALSVGTRGMELYQNGVMVGSNANTPTRTNNTNILGLGQHAFWGNADIGDYAFFYVYAIQLSQDAICHISNDPFCFYDWGEDLLVQGDVIINVPAASLALTVYAPIVSVPVVVPAANLRLTTHAPIVTVAGSGSILGDTVLQVDWNNDGDFNDAGEDVTLDLINTQPVVCERGKDQIRLLSPPMAGSFNCELNNQSRDYSVENELSPLYGNLLPGRSLRLQFLTSGDVTYPIFNGILDEISQYPAWGRRAVALPALGSLSKLKGKRISTSLYENIDTGTAINHVLTALGWGPNRSIATGQTILKWFWLENEDAFDAIVTILTTEGPGAAVYENAAGWFIFEDRHYRLTAVRSTSSQFTFTGYDYISRDNYTYESGVRDIINACEVQVVTRSAKAQSVLWRYGQPLIIGNNETRTVIAQFSDPIKDAETPDPDAGTNAVQLIEVLGTAPRLRLSFRGQQTGDITTSIQAALEALSSIGSGNVSVTTRLVGSDHWIWAVTFQNELGHQPIELLGASIVSDTGKPIEVRVSDDVVGIVDDFVLLAGSLDSITLGRTSGQSIPIEFTAGASGAYVDALQLRGRIVSVDSQQRIANGLDSSGSQDKYGLRSLSPSIRPEISGEEALQLADNFVRFYQDPRPIISFMVPGIDGTIQLQQLQREISDRIHIEEFQTGVDGDWFIERIGHVMTKGPKLFTQFGCEKVGNLSAGPGPGGSGQLWDSAVWDDGTWGS